MYAGYLANQNRWTLEFLTSLMLKIDGGGGDITIEICDSCGRSFLFRQLCPLISTGEGQSKINGRALGTSIENPRSRAMQSIFILASKTKIEPSPSKTRFSMVTPGVRPLIFMLRSLLKINGGFRSEKFSDRPILCRLSTSRFSSEEHLASSFAPKQSCVLS